jgi:hypothetical protein
MAIKDKEVYKGQTIKQVRGIIKVFDKFFEKEKFDHIVEIGTGNGVFSIYFALKAYEMGADFITFDIKAISPKVKKEITGLGAQVIICDITNDVGIDIIIKKPGRCLLLNDGGLKVPEFLRFVKIIKKDDIIMTHDYYKGRKEISGGTITMGEAKNSINKNKLNVIYEKEFDDYLWLCVIK